MVQPPILMQQTYVAAAAANQAPVQLTSRACRSLQAPQSLKTSYAQPDRQGKGPQQPLAMHLHLSTRDLSGHIPIYSRNKLPTSR